MMRFSKGNKAGNEMGTVNEDIFRREFAKVIKDGPIYGISIKKGKRFRSAFTTEQVNYLEKEFEKYPYIGNARRKDVATVLDIPERAVKIWFQNRRMKEKKETANKESDGGKGMEVNEQINEISAIQSINDGSLPSITISTSPTGAKVSVNTTSELKVKTVDFAHTDISLECTKDKNINSKRINPTVIQSNPASRTTTAGVLHDLSKKYKTEIKADEEKVAAAPGTKIFQKQMSPHVQYSEVRQDLGYPLYVHPVPAMPEDLSFKPIRSRMTSAQQGPEEKFNSTEVPFYLKGYYAPPYIPPGNMIWKPVNMTPIMTSAPIPALTISSSGPSMPNMSAMKRNCNCDCHTSYVAPMMLQNNPDPNMQYVVTAVPYQNTSS